VDESTVYEQLTDIMRDVLEDESIHLTPELTAKDVDGWDSLAHIRMLLTVEKTFGIKFSTSEISRLQNIGDLVSLIRSRA
jgi:acyl carrier protein